MGHSVDARCVCGYTLDELLIGAGKLNFRTVCAHPALCAQGRHVVTVNLFDAVHPCPDGHSGPVLPYATTPELQVSPGSESVSTWGEFELNDGGYRCPQCGGYTLHFSDAGLLFD